MSNVDKVSHTGVYGVIKNSYNEVLLIKKTRGPYTGLLDLPGGTPEFDESLEETLNREILEEIGLNVISSKQLTTILAHVEAKDILFRHMGVIFTCDTQGETKQDGDGEESGGCVWLNCNEINPKSCAPLVCKVQEVLKSKAFEEENQRQGVLNDTA